MSSVFSHKKKRTHVTHVDDVGTIYTVFTRIVATATINFSLVPVRLLIEGGLNRGCSQLVRTQLLHYALAWYGNGSRACVAATARPNVRFGMTDSSEFSFSSAIRGFHVYQYSWTPHIGQQLQAEKERYNHEDCFAVAVIKVGGNGSRSVVGYIPRELSRLLSHFLAHGGDTYHL